MSKTYRVAIADADASALSSIEGFLTRLGHRVITKADSVNKLIQSNQADDADLIVAEVLSEETLLELAGAKGHLKDIPAILTCTHLDPELLELECTHQVFGVLVKPLKEEELAAMIVVAGGRHQEFTQMREEASTLRKALEDRKVIEQAKGVIMKKCNLNEDNAFRHLQHLSRQHRQKLVEVAKSILIAEAAFKLPS